MNLNSFDGPRATPPEVQAMEREVDECFTYRPWWEKQISQGAPVAVALKDAVKVILMNVPPGPDRTVAIRKLREARMDCNSAITHGGKY